MKGFMCSLCHRWSPTLYHVCLANLLLRNEKTGQTRRLNLLEEKKRA